MNTCHETDKGKLRDHVLLASLLLCLAVGICAGCGKQPRHFTIDVLNGHTPVKSQGRSQLCWAYAMLATIETEHIMRGDSVNLSPAFVAHHLARDPRAPHSRRGMAATLLRLMDRYGVVPFDAMPDTLTPAPRWAFMLGMEYTPQEFARSVCAPGEYIALSSTADCPYGEQVELELADNWTHERFLNLPPDSLLLLAERAVKEHHGACWEGDTGDPGFNWDDGVACLSPLSALSRVSDDHCMAIVGLAHDDAGKPFFIMKNSWGQTNARKGLLFMSFDYFRRNTVALVLPRSVLADEN